eukprot:TRINITY_DN9885_c0_g1_i2.p1 TRINITY_DN9885_c0_g1~~TRINITY_DN9885_c0_g1_i2.p1  ORF type:complete len:205 (-),score=42.25 TRINITY_DN9885_c0_g1_i2:7-621(-)
MKSSRECVVKFKAVIASPVLTEGQGSEIKVTLLNKKNEPQPMVVAIIGLPGGLEPRHEKLKELVKLEKFDFYEIRGREIILYWRGMNPNDKHTFSIDVKAAVPGKYVGPASRAYLYYTPDHKQWRDGIAVEITPLKENWESSDSIKDVEMMDVGTSNDVSSVEKWLELHGLEEYKESFKKEGYDDVVDIIGICLLYTSPSPRDS